jgi:hypothetical protein
VRMQADTSSLSLILFFLGFLLKLCIASVISWRGWVGKEQVACDV